MESDGEGASDTGVVENIAAANEEQNNSEGGVIQNRLTNLEAHIHKLAEDDTKLFKKISELAEHETKMLQKQDQLTEKVDELTKVICLNNATNNLKKNQTLINKKEVIGSMHTHIDVQNNLEGDSQVRRKQEACKFPLEEKPRWKY